MNWALYLLWWLVICNGNTALLVAIVNRLHGYRLPEWVIHVSHKIHYLLMVAIPILVLLATGFTGASLLKGGHWQDLEPEWWIVFAFYAIAAVWFWWSVLERLIRKTPRQQLSVVSTRQNISSELGRHLEGQGPYAWMTRLPGNQIFQLEVQQREFLIPRLADCWDGLSILHFSDVHFIGTVDLSYFQKITDHAQALQADLICFTGDLFDNLKFLDWFSQSFDRLQAPLGRLFILGNHDWQLDAQPIRDELTRLKWHDVASLPFRLDRGGQHLVLKGSEFPWMGRNPSFADEDPEAIRILLSHTPDNIGHARAEKVDLMLSGHNHGGQVRLPVIGPVYCPSRFGCYYAEGLFAEETVLLHVSRGLAGRHPLRYNCRPEITKITLRSPASPG